MQVRHQGLDAGKAIALVGLKLGHGLTGGRVWHLDFERQTALVGEAAVSAGGYDDLKFNADFDQA